MKKSIQAISKVAFAMMLATNQVMAQVITGNSNSGNTLNTSSTDTKRNEIIDYIAGWMKWIVLVGILISIGVTAFYFLTGNKDKGKAWAVGCVTGLLIWFLAPTILAAFGVTLNW